MMAGPAFDMLAHLLTAIAATAWALYLADIGPNETQVLLAAVGAVSSLLNFVILRRDRRERNVHQAQVRDAIAGAGLVAMVPEQVVKDVAGAQPQNRRAGDEAP